MTTSRRHQRQRGPPAVIAVAAMLTACQPLPHPFADDRPPAALVTVRDGAGVSIGAIEGTPAAATQKLGKVLASALLKRDIPASDTTTNLGSYLLHVGLIEAPPKKGHATVTAYWRLLDAGGRVIGEKSVAVEAPAGEWEAGAAGPIERLAKLSVDGIAPLIEDETPVEAVKEPQGGGRARVVIGKISGAPGDGGKSLAAAVAAILRHQDLAVVEKDQKADLTIDGEVSVAPAKADTQHVKILWHVRRADGAEIGTVGEENDVPKGMLEGPWGDLAYNVAIAAGDGLLQLVARGLPAPKS
jgi:hypothetical protein